MRLKRTHLALLILSVVLSLTIPLLIGGFKEFVLLKRLAWWMAVFLAGMILVSWVFNSVRVRLLLRFMGKRIRFRDAMLIVISTEFAGTATPGSVGMPATYAFLLKKVGMSLGESIGLVSIAVLYDLTYYATMMPLAALGVLLSSPKGNSVQLVIAGISVIAAALFMIWLLAHYHHWVCSCIGRVMQWVPWLARRRYRVARKAVEFRRSLRLFRRIPWSTRFRLYGITAGYWLARYLVLVVIVLLVTGTAPVAYLLLVQGLLNLGGQIFILPGGGGGVEASYGALMSPYMGPEEVAFTLIVWRMYTFYWYLVVGGPVFLYKTGEAARDLLGGEKPAGKRAG